MEAPAGIEPANSGFADRPLSHLGTAPRTLCTIIILNPRTICKMPFFVVCRMNPTEARKQMVQTYLRRAHSGQVMDGMTPYEK